jgi:hypothetical protein
VAAIVFDATVADAASAAGPGSPGSGERRARQRQSGRAPRLGLADSRAWERSLLLSLKPRWFNTWPGRALVSRDVANLRGAAS